MALTKHMPWDLIPSWNIQRVRHRNGEDLAGLRRKSFMGLNAIDAAVIAIYLAGVTLFGLRFRNPQGTLRNYFLADNKAPWWAISLSIVAAETSTLTIISVPGMAYARNFQFLQLVFGYLIGRVVVAIVLIPQYFRSRLMTAYELIGHRFGQRLRAQTAGIFLLTRAAAEGVRVFAVAIVVRVALGGLLSGMSDLGRDICAIALVTLLTLAYTFEGGMAAVIWTDVVQLAIYVTATVLSLFTIVKLVPGGWPAISNIASAAGKFHMIDLSWNLTTTYTLWSGVIGGTFFTIASHGTDQLIVQRLLAARNERQSKVALIFSGVAVLIQFSLFLLVGAMLFVFYRAVAPNITFSRTDTIFPVFVVSHLAHGMSGLMIAAILAAAMSNLSAALNSLSSTTIVDFYARIRPNSSEQRRVQLSRLSTIGWALLLFCFALVARRSGRVLEAGLSIASVAYGSLLGVFLLGVFTRRASERGAMTGMLFGLFLNLFLWLRTNLSFAWYVVLGSAATFTVGYAVSWFQPRAEPAKRAKDSNETA